MKKLFVSLLLPLTFLYMAGCSKKNAETKSMDNLYEEKGVPVRAEKIEPKDFGSRYSFNSVLTGIEETNANAMISDKVEKINFKVGDKVQKDQIVITFPTDNPSAQYYQTKVSFEHAETTLKRIQSLYESGGISLQELDNTKTQYEVVKANWQSVQQAVRVKAPISGVITRIDVQEADNVKSGDRLFTISKTHKLKAELWVTDEQIGHIRKGNPATATWHTNTLKGRVIQADMALNSKHQAFGVVVEFDNPGQTVMSGINAEVVISGGTGNEKSIITDRKNLRREGDKWYAFVVNDSLSVKREIITGRQKDTEIEIIQGLNPGDMLITEGIDLLSDKTKINLISE